MKIAAELDATLTPTMGAWEGFWNEEYSRRNGNKTTGRLKKIRFVASSPAVVVGGAYL